MTDHTFEIAHDTRYYELLLAEYDAREKFARARAHMIEMASSPAGEFGFRPREARTEEQAFEKFEIGDVYALRAGYGEREYRTVSAPTFFDKGGENERTIHNHSYANADHALALLTPEHKSFEYVGRYEDARDALTAARAAVKAHDAAGYTGWTRYLLCTSSNGHVHSDSGCSTCRPTTTFAPVVSLSGCTADEAIAELGETLCSVCYPDAPIAGKIGKLTKAQAKKVLAGESIR